MNEKYNEVWKDAVGYEGRYKVSNMGRVKSLNYNHTGRELLLNLTPNKINGYVSCYLCNRPILVHRLVLMTFNPIDNMEEYQCDHINSIRDDNRLENLRWVSRSENNSTEHSKYMRRMNFKKTSHKYQFIKCVFQDGHIEYFRNIKDASDEIGCSTTLIVQALKTDREWKAKGCKLEYISRDSDECKNYKEELDNRKLQKIHEREETQRKERLQRKEAKRILRMQRDEEERKERRRQALIRKQNNVIRRIEARICVWNNHTSVIPTDAKERNLKKLREMLIQEQNRLRIFEAKIVNEVCKDDTRSYVEPIV